MATTPSTTEGVNVHSASLSAENKNHATGTRDTWGRPMGVMSLGREKMVENASFFMLVRACFTNSMLSALLVARRAWI